MRLRLALGTSLATLALTVLPNTPATSQAPAHAANSQLPHRARMRCTFTRARHIHDGKDAPPYTYKPSERSFMDLEYDLRARTGRIRSTFSQDTADRLGAVRSRKWVTVTVRAHWQGDEAWKVSFSPGLRDMERLPTLWDGGAGVVWMLYGSTSSKFDIMKADLSVPDAAYLHRGSCVLARKAPGTVR